MCGITRNVFIFAIIIVGIIIIGMIKVANPFVTGRYVSSEYFCDRVKETEQMRHHIVNGRDVALISPRRLGKTGLIEHLFAQDDIVRGYYTFFIDIYSTSSFDEFVYLLGKAIFAQMTKNKGFVDRFFSVIKSLRIGFKMDAVSGEAELNLGLGDIVSAETTLNEIFEYLASADRPCIIAIDEFQQITTYEKKNVEAILRTHIQHCSNAHFIFAGSRRHVMAQMFASASKPFYQSAITMGLEPIDEETYCSFAVEMFDKYGKKISSDVVRRVYTMTNGCTWYMQMLLNEMFAITIRDEECGEAAIDVALKNIVSTQSMTYAEIMALIGSKQKALLLAIAKEGVTDKVTSGAFIKKHSLASASSVQSAIKGLMEKDIITQEDGHYRLYDYFFAMWLNERY